MRFEPWRLEVDSTGSPPIHEAECTTCNAASGAADDKAEPELWCLRHAGRTGHSGFRGITTTFFRATRLG
ncbi:hypothetical protein DY218_17025 [Streptomyces triticagri]|uniref:DUF7848 domain-containing protein n=1 Tax=Streptomyces triticagri TaxID=2293568 RepID=A0A372M3P9_9ACTN|nr:hypothetical protein DY218_17025 [Streptomyces triticagri]